jgi:hypothetical protein
MKILIITVGNRQVGWRCQDGIVRCLGVSGNRNDATIPDHVRELYEEIGVEKPKSQYFVRHLGRLLYDECQRSGDFGAVELLLDRNIIEIEVDNGLAEVWLIGTDQPTPQVSDNFRSGDTLWLSKLMEGKIKQTWKDLHVETWNLQVDANDVDAIRDEYEQFILKYLIEKSIAGETTLLIENKGSVPAIASSLEICAAALIRQIDVVRVTPNEPNSMYLGDDINKKSAAFAVDFQQRSMSQYFLPIERLNISDAWKQGNFAGADIWLKSHQGIPKYRAMSCLAKLFVLVANLETIRSLSGIREWLNRKDVRSVVDEKLLEEWKEYPALNSTNRYDVIWEQTFLVYLYAESKSFTNSFFQLSQTLERFLFARFEVEKWLAHKVIEIPKEKERYANNYSPSFAELIGGWCKRDGIKETSSWYKLIDEIRKLRNEIIHNGKSVSENDITDLWNSCGVPVKTGKEAITLPLNKVCSKMTWKAPQQSLLGEINNWALNTLRVD